MRRVILPLSSLLLVAHGFVWTPRPFFVPTSQRGMTTSENDAGDVMNDYKNGMSALNRNMQSNDSTVSSLGIIFLLLCQTINYLSLI
jgi:hypothetical protein